MSIVEGRSLEEINKKNTRHGISLSLDRRVLVTHPGSEVWFSVETKGPPGHIVEVGVRGLPPSIATPIVNPSRGITPYASRVTLHVSNGAEPGLYPFHVVIYDDTINRLIEREKLGLLILPKEITPRHYIRLRSIYKEERLGAQGVLWYLLAKIYRNGATFMELKKAYGLVRGKPVTKATMAVVLKRMIKKGLIRKGEDGKYYPLVTKPKIAYSRIDRSRVRLPTNGENRERKYEETPKSPILKVEEPYVAKLAFKRAQRIAEKHDKLAAAYFLIHSLVGVRETGFLLLWLNGMFIYCESKTGMCHYFYSQLLHKYFQQLGLQQGIQYQLSREHEEARKIANRYVRKYYGSHQTSRRLHYALKEKGLLEYDEDIYNVEILYYADGSLGLRIWDNNVEELLYEENIREEQPVMSEIRPVYPFEHIYEQNEETYFHRPGGLY